MPQHGKSLEAALALLELLETNKTNNGFMIQLCGKALVILPLNLYQQMLVSMSDSTPINVKQAGLPS